MVVKTWDNGDKYEGDWVDEKKHGQGTLNYADGGKYEGEWANNMRNGYGVNTWANGDRYDGNWKNSKKNGQGKLFYANKGKYIGEWNNDKRNGQGVNIWPNGNKYEGSWKNNLQDGQGTYTYKDGGTYVGEWANNMRHGKGVNTWKNGNRYEGMWRRNKRHGQGTMYNADGTQQSGTWKNDKLSADASDDSDSDGGTNDNGNTEPKNQIKVKGSWLNGQRIFLTFVSKSDDCPYLALAREFIISLKWEKSFFNNSNDHCYCDRCYKESWKDVIPAGNDKYVIPRGWVRLGLHVDPVLVKTQDVWNKWIVTFHGTTKIAARSILTHRQFCLPGDVLIDGTKLGIRPGHIPNKQYIYTSPTIAYSSGLAYSPIYDFHSNEHNAPFQTQIVLQCRQMPNTYEIGPETIGAGTNQICPHIPNAQIEYFTDRRSSLLAYGLLARFRPKN